LWGGGGYISMETQFVGVYDANNAWPISPVPVASPDRNVDLLSRSIDYTQMFRCYHISGTRHKP